MRFFGVSMLCAGSALALLSCSSTTEQNAVTPGDAVVPGVSSSEIPVWVLSSSSAGVPVYPVSSSAGNVILPESSSAAEVSSSSLSSSSIRQERSSSSAPLSSSVTELSSSAVAPSSAAALSSAADDSFVEDHADDCTLPASYTGIYSLKSVSALPDPFTFLNGTPVADKAQWKCRREEISALLQNYELGEKPRKPESVTGSLSGNTFKITVKDKGKTITFGVTISKPSGAGPFPAVIGYQGGNLGGALSGMSVATINFSNFVYGNGGESIANDGTARGGGLFYNIYGSGHSAGGLIAWAWGVSRIIDALEATPSAGIDPRKIAVTGCSRNGKGALVAGAFDERIALTIPQESGSGGASSWRLIASEKSGGKNIQTLGSACTECAWFRSSFCDFQNSADKLPFDHHLLEGMIAPRGLLVIDNNIDWLGPNAGYGSGVATAEIYKALGASEAFTYTQVGGHDHCSLPSSQYHWVQSYVKKYLLDGTGEPAKIEAAGMNFDKTKWIPWTTPRY